MTVQLNLFVEGQPIRRHGGVQECAVVDGRESGLRPATLPVDQVRGAARAL